MIFKSARPNGPLGPLSARAGTRPICDSLGEALRKKFAFLGRFLKIFYMFLKIFYMILKSARPSPKF